MPNQNPPPLRPLHIALIGAGPVGGSVYEILMHRLGGASCTSPTLPHPFPPNTPPPTTLLPPPPPPNIHNPSLQRRCVVTKICVRDRTKPRDFVIDEGVTQVLAAGSGGDGGDGASWRAAIVEDDSIDVVVEVMGGVGVAREVVLESLRRGKSVVTANKALVAECMDEIRDLVLGSGGKVKFGYEAAVCGGIPIINSLQGCYAGDLINEVMGICNQTTNYMLCRMKEGVAYDDALKEAQDLGYTKADPTADVQGHNVRAKTAILAKLAFGTTVHPSSIPCRGITPLLPIDFEYAKLLDCTIKLIGTATRLSEFGEHDGPLSVYVSPKLVPNSHLLASIEGSGNAVTVESANLGCCSLLGPGAGRFPTANSVVADVCRIASGTIYDDPFPLESTSVAVDSDYSSCFYIRVSFQDELGIIRKIGELAEGCGISINSVLQNPMKDRMFADCVVTTEDCKMSQVTELCGAIGLASFSKCEPLFMPMFSSW